MVQNIVAMVHFDGDGDEMVKQLSDSIVDLALPTVQNPDVRQTFGATRDPELIFLGPDENMNPERIQWVADRAAMHKLPHATCE